MACQLCWYHDLWWDIAYCLLWCSRSRYLLHVQCPRCLGADFSCWWFHQQDAIGYDGWEQWHSRCVPHWQVPMILAMQPYDLTHRPSLKLNRRFQSGCSGRWKRYDYGLQRVHRTDGIHRLGHDPTSASTTLSMMWIGNSWQVSIIWGSKIQWLHP